MNCTGNVRVSTTILPNSVSVPSSVYFEINNNAIWIANIITSGGVITKLVIGHLYRYIFLLLKTHTHKHTHLL